VKKHTSLLRVNKLRYGKKKCKDDSETANWIVANTKPCPRCKTAIEKNEGCNHMTCRKCTHEFCWLCFANWSGHTACNKFNPDQRTELAKTSLSRYLHYYHRFSAHQASRTFETALRAKAIDKMMELRARSESQTYDVTYIEQAVEQLIECRRTLQFTYVYAFYLAEGGAEKNLFEYLQAELETNTEKLSEVLEKPLSFDINERLKIMDVKNQAGTRLQHLLEGVEDALGVVSKGIRSPDKEEPKNTTTTANNTTASNTTANNTKISRRGFRRF